MRDYTELEERLIHEVNGILFLALTASKRKKKKDKPELLLFFFSYAVVIILRWMQTLLIGNISYQRTSP